MSLFMRVTFAVTLRTMHKTTYNTDNIYEVSFVFFFSSTARALLLRCDVNIVKMSRKCAYVSAFNVRMCRLSYYIFQFTELLLVSCEICAHHLRVLYVSFECTVCSCGLLCVNGCLAVTKVCHWAPLGTPDDVPVVADRHITVDLQTPKVGPRAITVMSPAIDCAITEKNVRPDAIRKHTNPMRCVCVLLCQMTDKVNTNASNYITVRCTLCIPNILKRN